MNFPLFPRAASTLAQQVDPLMLMWLGVAGFFSVLIAVLLFFLAVRYRRRREHDIGHPEHAPMLLEVIWSAIPLAILLAMFAWGAKVYFYARRPPADAVEYYVTGKQWMWKFQHPEGVRELNRLHVPVGQPIKLTMTSEDVIHSFFVPDFRVKMDVIPGRYSTTWFEATRTGTFYLFCAEYCGVEHSRMGGEIVVMEPSQYDEWLESQSGTAQAVMLTGEDLFQAKNCHTCHRTDSNNLAPFLTGLFGHEVEFADGSTTVVDENYLRESILDPTARLVAGYQALMPTYQGQLTEEELAGLILYIKSLAEEGGGEPQTVEPLAENTEEPTP